MHSSTYIGSGVATAVLLLIAVWFFFKRRPRKLNIKRFGENWKSVQGLCRNPETWPKALIDADELLDKALKLRRMKGKTMGERLVSAQRSFSDNDSVWFAHKLRKQIEDEKNPVKLDQNDVMEALVGIRKALKDLGALE